MLMFISTFCVSYVRTQLQFRKTPWSEGIVYLLSSLVTHYFAIGVVAMLVGAIYLAGPSWLISRNESESKTRARLLFDVGVIVDLVFFTALIGSLLVWFLMVGGLFVDDYE
jgi:cytochrome bd-type quinol oxidase subunit 2